MMSPGARTERDGCKARLAESSPVHPLDPPGRRLLVEPVPASTHRPLEDGVAVAPAFRDTLAPDENDELWPSNYHQRCDRRGCNISVCKGTLQLKEVGHILPYHNRVDCDCSHHSESNGDPCRGPNANSVRLRFSGS